MQARETLTNVNIEREQLLKIANLCSELNIDGLRGDIVLTRAAKALTAFENKKTVSTKEIYTVATLCLRHRLRKDPLENIDSGMKVQEIFKKVFEN